MRPIPTDDRHAKSSAEKAALALAVRAKPSCDEKSSSSKPTRKTTHRLGPERVNPAGVAMVAYGKNRPKEGQEPAHRDTIPQVESRRRASSV
jgi:hypothetical protein